jgi:hypothetical protein
LSAKFEKFYEHRSQIVHGKKARLDKAQVDLLLWCQRVLRRAIEKEVDALPE